MKKILLLLILAVAGASNSFSQTQSALKEIAGSVCDCLNNKDLNAIKTDQEAKSIFVNCFIGNTALIMKLADDSGIDITDGKAGERVGVDIAKEMLRQNCSAFMKLSLKMADNTGEKGEEKSATGITNGKLKRVENKEFLYFVMKDETNREQSFIWLHYFQGSEKFIKDQASFIGKKMKIQWQEIEVFMPSAKGYFKIKEIAGIDVE
jgi:hypothetical protein